MNDSKSVDDMAQRLCDNAIKNTVMMAPNAPADAHWTVLSLMAEGHRRAAKLIDAEAAKFTPASIKNML